jgi:putative membrane protein
MRTVRAFEILSLAVPLVLASCSKESDREAKSPSGSTTYGYDADSAATSPAEPTTMTPASRTDETAPATIPPPANQGAAPEPQASTTLNDAQIAALTDAANTAEVDAAKYALQKAKNAKVRKFAQMMIDHHGKAQRDQAKLVSKLGLTLEESTKLRDLKTSAGDTDRTLKAAPDDSFDKVYIDIQVADHQMVLDSLDRDFIPNTQNADLKKSLQDFRPKVEQHLNQALELQKMLMTSSSSGSKSTTGSGSSGSKSTTGSGSSDSKTGNGSATGSGSGTSSGSTTR